MTDNYSVMLAAGGTAGHLFPAFALAEELAKRGIIVDLATDLRGNRYGDDFPARTVYKIPSATVRSKSPVALASTAASLARGLVKAYGILGKARPAAVIGFGGYPTAPPLIAAHLRGIPTAIHEQNAVLGRANKMLASRVDHIATTFANTKFLPASATDKVHQTGNPVRSSVLNVADIPYPEISAHAPLRILIFGGSQGARFLSDAVPEALAGLSDSVRQRLVVHQQAREEDVMRVRDVYSAANITATVDTFFADLPELMASAHLVMARAGASTVAELGVIGRPAILVPLPGSLDNDQLENARHLAESGAAWCIEQKDLSPQRLMHEFGRLLAEPGHLAKAAEAAKRAGKPNAAGALADLVEGMIRRSG